MSFEDDLNNILNNLPEPSGDDGEEQPICPTCRGQGQILTYTADVYVPGETPTTWLACPDCEKGQRLQKHIWDSHLKNSHMPPLFKSATFEAWGNPAAPNRDGKIMAYAACMTFSQYLTADFARIAGFTLKILEAKKQQPPQRLLELLDVQDTRPGLIIWGDFGVGKTWLTACAANAIGKRGKSVLYIRFPHLLQTLRDSWKNEQVTGELLDTYITAPVLMLDDVGNSRTELAPHAINFASELFRERFIRGLPTLMTSNLNRTHFRAVFGEIAAEIIDERCHWIEMGGNKLRKSEPLQGDIRL